jgi:hypothetical protein
MFYYLVQKSPLQPIPPLSKMDPIYTFQLFPKICSNIIFRRKPRSTECSVHLGLSNQNFGCYLPRPSHPPLFDHPNNIWRRLHIMELLELCIFLYRSLTLSLSGPNISSSTLLSVTLKLYPSLNVRGILNPCEITNRV